MFTAAEERFMRRALVLARRGAGRTSPNPAVGAVLVRAGRTLGEGWHHAAGQPHAEIEALQAAGLRFLGSGGGPKAKPGTTLYVTLEPCCTHGRTPPCTGAIIAAGVQRVVVAATDPNPRHRGRGLRQLRQAGVAVASGLLEHEATDLNPAFNKWMVTGLPLVIAKAAMSLDGKIATRTGESQWITDASARRLGHQVRGQVDAVMVAAGTVRRDDPQLTLRHGVRGRQPWRVVVDGRGRSPLTARVFTDSWRTRTLVVTTRLASAAWRATLTGRGVPVVTVRRDGDHVDLSALLRALGKRAITSVLMEGGGDFLGALFEQQLIDRVMFCYAPLVIGGREAVGAVQGRGVGRLAEAVRFGDGRWTRLRGGQMLFEGCVERRR